MKKTILNMAGALMLLIPSTAGAQVLPFIVADTDPVALAKGSANLTETGTTAYAAFNNPAAIPFSDAELDASIGYAMWQPSEATNNTFTAAAAYNLNNRFGFTAGFHYGLHQKYDIINNSGITTGSFMPKDMHIAAGFSYRFLPEIALGINLGYADSELTEEHSYGVVDADIMLMMDIMGVKFSTGFTNISGTVETVGGEEFRTPASFVLGLGYDRELGEKHDVQANFDLDYFVNGGCNAASGAGYTLAIGADYTYNDFATFRAGYRYGGDSPIPSFASVGAGIKFAGFKLDLAYLIACSDSPLRNTFALAVGYSF